MSTAVGLTVVFGVAVLAIAITTFVIAYLFGRP